jgi:2-methylisocitrate lyase-like PEP mutase family enzyme
MPENKFVDFRNLHQQQSPLVIVNIWDAGSAIIVQANGAQALATSSASLAWSNGYSDGGDLPLDILMHSVSRILRVSKVPLSIDIENGYSDSPDEVAELVKNLMDKGVSGINLEDGEGSTELLVEKILAIKELCGENDIFINARTDVYLRELVSAEARLEECISRLNKYISCGADGVFVPGLISIDDISKVSGSIGAPLNIMVPSDVGYLEEIIDAGVARISLGPATFLDTYSTLSNISEKSLKANEPLTLSYDNLNRMCLSNR